MPTPVAKLPVPQLKLEAARTDAAHLSRRSGEGELGEQAEFEQVLRQKRAEPPRNKQRSQPSEPVTGGKPGKTETPQAADHSPNAPETIEPDGPEAPQSGGEVTTGEKPGEKPEDPPDESESVALPSSPPIVEESVVIPSTPEQVPADALNAPEASSLVQQVKVAQSGPVLDEAQLASDGCGDEESCRQPPASARQIAASEAQTTVTQQARTASLVRSEGVTSEAAANDPVKQATTQNPLTRITAVTPANPPPTETTDLTPQPDTSSTVAAGRAKSDAASALPGKGGDLTPVAAREVSATTSPLQPQADVTTNPTAPIDPLPVNLGKPAAPSPHSLATPPPPPTPAEIEFAAANHDRLVTAMRTHLLPRGGTMLIRLDPPNLGAVQVAVSLDDGVMSVAFQTTSDQATRLLSHSLTQLKHVLESQGLSVDKLNVQQAPRDHDSARQDAQQHQDHHDDSAARQQQQRQEMLRRMWRRLALGSDPLDLVA